MKKNNGASFSSWTSVRHILILPIIISLACLPARASHSASNNKKTKLSSNIDSQQNIGAWFNSYDNIRRQAQMSPAERQKADEIMRKGLAIFMPGADKVLAQHLLSDLVHRYEVAAQEMANLQVIPATEKLHRAYYQYFLDARKLFSDYLKLQDDLMATDPTTGQPVASGLVERKENLAALDQNNKLLDEQIRQQYGIPAYQYTPGLSQPAIPRAPGMSTYPQSYQGQPNF